jgi:prevent-host-death family protein
MEMEKVGIRELRNYASRVVARARAGERIVITVDGIPAAEIGPVRRSNERMTMDQLIAAGHAIPPRDTSPAPPPPAPYKIPDGRTSMQILDELRGDRF